MPNKHDSVVNISNITMPKDYYMVNIDYRIEIKENGKGWNNNNKYIQYES